MTASPANTGRPPKEPSGTRRNNVTIRMTDRLYESVAGSAAIERRSLSDEIAARLAQSYADDKTLADMDRLVRGQVEAEFGGRAGYDVAKIIAGLIQFVEDDTGASWRKDSATNQRVVAEVLGFLTRYGAPVDFSAESLADARHQGAGTIAKLLMGQAPSMGSKPDD